MMTRIVTTILLLFLCCIGSEAQQDAQLGQQLTPFTVIARGANWGSGSPGACTSRGCVGGFVNNNFVFNPVTSDGTACLEIINNNPTSSHTVTITLSETHDPRVVTYLSNTAKWIDVGGYQNNGSTGTTFTSVTINAASQIGFAFNTYGAATLALRLSGSSAAGGSPDTADILLSETRGINCGISQLVLGVTTVQGPYAKGSVQNSGVKPVVVAGMDSSNFVNVIPLDAFHEQLLLAYSNPLINGAALSMNTLTFISSGTTPGAIQVLNLKAPLALGPSVPSTGSGMKIASGLGSEFETQGQFNSWLSWSIQASTVNPAANADLLQLDGTNTAVHNMALHKAWVSCSAACEIKVASIQGAGSGCTAVGARAASFGITQTLDAQWSAAFACTTPPTLFQTYFDWFLPANDTREFNLDGLAMYANSSQGNNGIIFSNVSAITGTATVTLQFNQEQ